MYLVIRFLRFAGSNESPNFNIWRYVSHIFECHYFKKAHTKVIAWNAPSVRLANNTTVFMGHSSSFPFSKALCQH